MSFLIGSCLTEYNGVVYGRTKKLFAYVDMTMSIARWRFMNPRDNVRDLVVMQNPPVKF